MAANVLPPMEPVEPKRTSWRTPRRHASEGASEIYRIAGPFSPGHKSDMCFSFVSGTKSSTACQKSLAASRAGRREEGGGCKSVCGGREGTFSSGKKSPPFPRPPFPPPKTAHRANRIMEGVSGKKGLDDTTGRDGKNVALSPSGYLPQELSVPPLLRRAPHSTGDQHGARGCRGCAGPDPLPLRRACPARMPGNGRHPTAIPQSASELFPASAPPKNAKGAGPPEEDRPLCKIGLSTGSRRFHQLPAA